MTRKDYKLIAGVIEEAPEFCRLYFARAFAIRLAETQQHFDANKFLAECGHE